MSARQVESDDAGCSSYYSVLGICSNASATEIRTAYRKLALKWHPDKWMRNPKVAGEAQYRFQKIQEAYSVLSDKGKRSMYDAELVHLFQDEDDGFSDFMQELLSMVEKARPQGESLEELQKMLVEMAREEGITYGIDGEADRHAHDRKRTRVSRS
ncbi:PREDICTED: dnaJ homolog subfamily B member 6-like [Nelumbo nucifera]|uniref:J domain-containing protein n=2 Tax=Nelumbo nucifera TaxID=4432 RepID=A0A822Z589_NELNU|nr:PREDICTED: dnaJ homolog subfamily B member 6-like [Nelumbo nucifera]DAD38166.1 TPA_asm: hypothetical protein HUJ06_008807 [Nelumbo nucifera]